MSKSCCHGGIRDALRDRAIMGLFVVLCAGGQLSRHQAHECSCSNDFPRRSPKSMYGGMYATPRRPQFYPAGTQKRRVTFNSNSPFYLRMWRRGRDLNSRYRFKPVYSLSRRAPSAGSDTSPQHVVNHRWTECRSAS